MRNIKTFAVPFNPDQEGWEACQLKYDVKQFLADNGMNVDRGNWSWFAPLFLRNENVVIAACYD